MNMLALTASHRQRTDVVAELQNEAKGSFSVLYRALREVSHATGSGKPLSKSEVIKAIHKIQAADKKTTRK
jgi:hypothetical protein